MSVRAKKAPVCAPHPCAAPSAGAASANVGSATVHAVPCRRDQAPTKRLTPVKGCAASPGRDVSWVRSAIGTRTFHRALSQLEASTAASASAKGGPFFKRSKRRAVAEELGVSESLSPTHPGEEGVRSDTTPWGRGSRSQRPSARQVKRSSSTRGRNADVPPRRSRSIRVAHSVLERR